MNIMDNTLIDFFSERGNLTNEQSFKIDSAFSSVYYKVKAIGSTRYPIYVVSAELKKLLFGIAIR